MNRLLVFHFPNRPLSYCHDHNDILWNDKTFSGFFSGKTDSSQAETFHNKPLKELEGCVAFVKLSCSSSLVCQLEYILDFLNLRSGTPDRRLGLSSLSSLRKRNIGCFQSKTVGFICTTISQGKTQERLR